MSAKTQNEYLQQLKDIIFSTASNEKAFKLIYQWTITGKLKQKTLVEFMNFITEV